MLTDEVFRTEKQINIGNKIKTKTKDIKDNKNNLNDQIKTESLGIFSINKASLDRKNSLKLKIFEVDSDEEEEIQNEIEEFVKVVFKDFECVNTMSVGEGFGELALL